MDNEFPETIPLLSKTASLFDTYTNGSCSCSNLRSLGLIKKAHEISVLCDADVALVIFSPKGKLYEYSANSNMEKILDRYHRYSCAESTLLEADAELQAGIGEQLETFTYKELWQLEQQLDTSLRLTRSRKNQLLFDSIAELHRKEKSLEEHNSILEELLENDKVKALSPNRQSPLAVTDSLPNLNIGTYRARGMVDQEEELVQPLARVSSDGLPPWILGHVKG